LMSTPTTGLSRSPTPSTSPERRAVDDHEVPPMRPASVSNASGLRTCTTAWPAARGAARAIWRRAPHHLRPAGQLANSTVVLIWLPR
jgi:hypothetical protein